jgi:hypothetical protein
MVFMGNHENKKKVGKCTEKSLKMEAAKKLSTKNKQHKCRATKREKLVRIHIDANPIYTNNINRPTSRLANHIGPLLHEITSMNSLEYQQLTLEKILKQPILKQPCLIW